MSNREVVMAEPQERVQSARWYHDRDGQFWHISKADGGLRVENEDGTFGRPVPSWVARDEFGVQPCDPDVAAVLDEFEKLKKVLDPSIHGTDMRVFRNLRENVLRIVEALGTVDQAKEA